MTGLTEFRTVDELGAELWPNWPGARRRKWVYRQVEVRGMPAIRLGRQLVFEVAAVAAWFDQQRSGGAVSDLAAIQESKRCPSMKTAPPTRETPLPQLPDLPPTPA